MTHINRSVLAAASVAATLLLGSAAAMATTTYTYDFESGSVGPEWSMPSLGLLEVDTTPSGRKFLGRKDFHNLGLNNDVIKLTLGSLPSYSGFTLSFDLYAIQSLDGDSVVWGQDRIGAFAHSGLHVMPLFLTDFSNVPSHDQTYPGNHPTLIDHPYQTGAAEVNTLGYTSYGDSVYHLSFSESFGQTTDPLHISFFAENLQHITDESWGIDNVRVELTGTPAPVPIPPAVWLLGTGLISLAGIARRRQA